MLIKIEKIFKLGAKLLFLQTAYFARKNVNTTLAKLFLCRIYDIRNFVLATIHKLFVGESFKIYAAFSVHNFSPYSI